MGLTGWEPGVQDIPESEFQCLPSLLGSLCPVPFSMLLPLLPSLAPGPPQRAPPPLSEASTFSLHGAGPAPSSWSAGWGIWKDQCRTPGYVYRSLRASPLAEMDQLPARQSRQLWQPPTGGDMDRPSLANSDLTWVLGGAASLQGAEGTASCLLGPAAGFVFPGSPHLGNRTGTGGPPWHCPTACHRARPCSTLSSLC